MRTAKQKIYLTLVLFGAMFLILIIFGFLPFFKKVKTISQEFNLEKNTLDLVQTQLEELKDFQRKASSYHPFLEELQKLFVVEDAPISFIEFLEKEAKTSQLSLKINPLNIKPSEADPWIPVSFSVSLGGSFPSCLRFLDRLENSPWLVDIFQLNVERVSKKSSWQRKFESLQPGDVYFNLSLKAFSGKEIIREK